MYQIRVLTTVKGFEEAKGPIDTAVGAPLLLGRRRSHSLFQIREARRGDVVALRTLRSLPCGRYPGHWYHHHAGGQQLCLPRYDIQSHFLSSKS